VNRADLPASWLIRGHAPRPRASASARVFAVEPARLTELIALVDRGAVSLQAAKRIYADLAICGLSGLGVFTGIFGLARGAAGPPGLAIPSFILSAAGLALFIWMLETRVQGSVWGARKAPNLRPEQI